MSFFAKNKFITKFVAFLLFVCIVPLVLNGLISYHTSRATLLESDSKFRQHLLHEHAKILGLLRSQVDNLIANISGVEEITKVLNDKDTSLDNYDNLVTKARIGYILNGYLNLKGLVSIDIFTEGGRQYHVGDTLSVDTFRRDIQQQIRTGAIASDPLIYQAGIIPNLNKESKYKHVLASAKIINAMNRKTLEKKPIALLVVSYNIKQFAEYFSKKVAKEDSSISLIDHNGNIIYTDNETDIGKPASGELLLAANQSEESSTVNWNNATYVVHKSLFNHLGWQLISINSEQDILYNAQQIRMITFFLVFCGILFVSAGLYYFFIKIIIPLRSVIEGYKSLKKGNFDLNKRLPVNSTDEMGELIKWFNRFLDIFEQSKISENNLRSSEQRYALAVNATKDTIWDWDLSNDDVYYSPRFRTLVGLDSENTPISNHLNEWLERIHPDDLQLVKLEISHHKNGKSSKFHCEYRLKDADDHYKWVISRGLIVCDEEGNQIRMVGSHSDISDRKEAEEKLIHGAFHDALTGLYNRAWLISFLRTSLDANARNNHANFALLYLDLDHFKHVNDTMGHGAGDQLLIETTGRLKSCLRASDILARLGGDEFVICLQHTDDQHFIEIADRIIELLSNPYTIAGQEVRTGVSIGITASSSGYHDPDEMLRDSDVAMYQAKNKGKNCYVIFDLQMREKIDKRLTIEKELEKAINKSQFSLHYQPIFDLKTDQIIACEALIRWNHKKLGYICPTEFIPIAESSRLIYPLGKWIINEGLKQWSEWKQQFFALNTMHLSINLSSLQFHDDTLISSLPETFMKYGLQGADIAFEITETAIIQDMALAQRVITQLKELGCAIHLDDFGTGYSSLNHLSDFAIDVIKIDRSFVNKSLTDSKQQKIVKGLINLAHKLDIKCTAEGVEHLEQSAMLKAEDCTFGQGYLFSKPLNKMAMKEYFISYFKASL